ncbi:hypothetical protein D9M70_649590 [compost metagenome]
MINRSERYRIRCPWGHEHGNGDHYGAFFRGPVEGQPYDYVFGCSHDTCRRKRRKWGAFVDEVVMPPIEDALDRANRDALSSDSPFYRMQQQEAA